MSTTLWLTEDLTGQNTANFIEDEVHELSGTSYNRIVIAPDAGPFYSHDITITFRNAQGATRVLNSKEDYRLIGLDIGRTKVSSATGGVYHFILLTISSTINMDAGDKIILSYHAFGGIMNSRAYTDMIRRIEALEGSGGSGGGSGSAEEIAELEQKVNALVRRMNYSPAVSSTISLSSGSTTVWKTVATSSDYVDSFIAFNNNATLKGTGTFLLYSANHHAVFYFSYEIKNSNGTISCDLKCDTVTQQITKLKVNQEIYANDYFQHNEMIIPMFRLRVNTDSTLGSSHRLALEMALASNTNSTYAFYFGDQSDEILIPNQSVLATAWNLYDSGTNLNMNNSILSNEVLGLQEYYKIWQGNISMRKIEEYSWTSIHIDHSWNIQSNLVPAKTENGYLVWPFVSSSLYPDMIKRFKVEIYDRYEEQLISVEAEAVYYKPFSSTQSTRYSVYACFHFFAYDNGVLELVLTGGGATRPQIKLYGTTGCNSYINSRFDVRGIYMK